MAGTDVVYTIPTRNFRSTRIMNEMDVSKGPSRPMEWDYALSGMCANMNLCVSTKLYLPSRFIQPNSVRSFFCSFLSLFRFFLLLVLCARFSYVEFSVFQMTISTISHTLGADNSWGTHAYAIIFVLDNNRTSYANPDEIQHSTVISGASNERNKIARKKYPSVGANWVTNYEKAAEAHLFTH